MSTDLERALSKLRFDDQVLGYSLMTKAGRPFVSFAFPDELLPRIKDSINLYKADLRLMTIDTEKGLVVLSPVDENWILTVLYVPELQLGLAIAKTKNVLRLLEGIELPPPPDDFEESSDGNLQVLETIAIKAASTSAEEAASVPVETPVEPEPTVAATKSPDDYVVQASTIPARGTNYSTSLSLDSELYSEMKSEYRNFGFDALMLVDGKADVTTIADFMFQPTERVSDFLKWAAMHEIVDVPVIKTTAETKATPGKVGKFVKCPKFTGEDSKVSGDDWKLLSLCNGSRTTETIADSAGVLHSVVIKILAKYRKEIKMIGKSQ
ncbi:MAG: hypothetical protein ACTSUO_05780 [Candidatus Thorarchaeota archaeon]